MNTAVKQSSGTLETGVRFSAGSVVLVVSTPIPVSNADRSELVPVLGMRGRASPRMTATPGYLLLQRCFHPSRGDLSPEDADSHTVGLLDELNTPVLLLKLTPQDWDS